MCGKRLARLLRVYWLSLFLLALAGTAHSEPLKPNLPSIGLPFSGTFPNATLSSPLLGTLSEELLSEAQDLYQQAQDLNKQLNELQSSLKDLQMQYDNLNEANKKIEATYMRLLLASRNETRAWQIATGAACVGLVLVSSLLLFK